MQSNAKEINKKLERAESRNESLMSQIDTLQDESEQNLKSKIEIEAALATIQSETKVQIAELKDLIAAKVRKNRNMNTKGTLIDSEEIENRTSYTGC